MVAATRCKQIKRNKNEKKIVTLWLEQQKETCKQGLLLAVQTHTIVQEVNKTA